MRYVAVTVPMPCRIRMVLQHCLFSSRQLGWGLCISRPVRSGPRRNGLWAPLPVVGVGVNWRSSSSHEPWEELSLLATGRLASVCTETAMHAATWSSLWSAPLTLNVAVVVRRLYVRWSSGHDQGRRRQAQPEAGRAMHSWRAACMHGRGRVRLCVLNLNRRGRSILACAPQQFCLWTTRP
jgi:hypothetical protein